LNGKSDTSGSDVGVGKVRNPTNGPINGLINGPKVSTFAAWPTRRRRATGGWRTGPIPRQCQVSVGARGRLKWSAAVGRRLRASGL